MLYHREVYWPEWLERAIAALPVAYRPKYGHHARTAARNDRYGFISLPRQVSLHSYEVIEAEVDPVGIVTKLLLRGVLDRNRDICIVIIPQRAFVKTVWINERNDLHTTLNTDRYVQG